ncbi:Defensin [Frankliniella occidentalis]|uniref:Defensin n=1 Tax=Frankliniella occidentalis TaxID=133901 RepID=A0A6J1SRW1_FRAOC|nr:defensin [Frankliniella occidentalis]KAE8742150.1 Defensin [Frankliniella occidentalis]
MKSFTTVALVLVVLAAALQQSTADADLPQHEVGDSPGPSSTEDGPRLEVRAGRHARATCDLLSFQSKWVTPNHAGCAAHCLAMFKGFKGGYCKDAVCHCRK